MMVSTGMFRRIKPLLITVLFTTVAFPLAITTFAQEQQYSFVTKWGSEGVGFGKFRQPLDIAIDFDNNVYVTDTTSLANQIQKFSTNGTFITSWGVLGFGDGLFTSARGIDMDSSGNVYVTDGGSPETGVQKFTNNGTFITSWGQRAWVAKVSLSLQEE
jgi:DNA-binding beta-propeller fold protein YncE